MVNIPAPRKALKIGRVLKSAALLPTKVTSSRGSGRSDALSPVQGELPLVLLRVQVIGCTALAAKDRGGTSDPFVTVTVLSTKHQTPVSKKNINPEYNPKDATFDFPIHMSLAEKLGAIELVVWDKDMLRKEYLGEVSLMLEDWFANRHGYGFLDAENKPLSMNIASTRTNVPPEGSIQIKLGFIEPPQASSLLSFKEIYQELTRRSCPRASVMSAPPTAGVGTIRSNAGGPEYEDDGFSSDENEFEDAHEDFTDDEYGGGGGMSTGTSTPLLPPSRSQQQASSKKPLLSLPLQDHKQEPLGSEVTTPTADELHTPVPRTARPPFISTPSGSPVRTEAPPFPPSGSNEAVGSTKPEGHKSGFSKFIRRPTLPIPLPSGRRTPSRKGTSESTNTTATTPVDETSAEKLERTEKATRPDTKRGKSFGRRKAPGAYNLAGEDDIVGIVMLEIQGASDLPRLSNMTRTGWDMDPFVIISFGKKVFRTRVIRHSRNPQWDEKLLFHVRRYETRFDIKLTVLDWDKLSSNDHIGDATFPVAKLLDHAPQKDESTGLYDVSDDCQREMVDFSLPLSTGKEMPWESKHSPKITFKAKYQSYGALRQKFWRQYLKQYDANDDQAISRLELTSMLDSLGSTLSGETIDAFFASRGKDRKDGELTVDEAVQSLEAELFKPNGEKKRLDASDYRGALDDTMPGTPALGGKGAAGDPFGQLDFAGPAGHIPNEDVQASQKEGAKPNAPPAYNTESNQQPLSDAIGINKPSLTAALGTGGGGPDVPVRLASDSRYPSSPGSDRDPLDGGSGEGEDSSNSGSSSPTGRGAVERVINVKTCPLCHRPRLSKKGELDIVTHLAICASQDWERVDKIVVGNFVTSSQAQRKWMAKLIGKVSSGAYKLGANSANIIVQNRMTGHLEEEKMQVYVRLGIRLLYKGAKSRMEGARARGLLKSMSVKQGVKFDSPDSAKEILPFIAFHGLNVSEMLEDPSSFKTFNQFFYRKLKPDARPAEEPENPARLVSVADCRMMAFETVQDATRIWIKGREFTVARLLGDAYKSQAEKYQGGALAIFRLAPQDYHRFHSPVDGVVGPITYIAGEYYTVNPQAIRTPLDVYGENARKIVPFDSPVFGRVMAVCIGAMMVGSILTTKKEGDQIKRGEEFGYFAFGGSTIVLLFEKGVVEWDEDLVINGKASLETLVRVGMGIGRRT